MKNVTAYQTMVVIFAMLTANQSKRKYYCDKAYTFIVAMSNVCINAGIILRLELTKRN